MTFRPMSEARRAEWTARRKAEQAAQREDTTRRMLAAYRAESDREYAEAMWGDALRARGVDLSPEVAE